MTLHGMNFVAGGLTAENSTTLTAVDPATELKLETAFHHASENELDRAVRAADLATREMRELPAKRRSSLLRKMATEIDLLGDELIVRCSAETGLPVSRFEGERARMTNQLRMFADLVDEGSWVDARIDTAIPDRKPLPKPDVRRMLIALGPVAVFCASNFPLAFSVAGGDTASAIAAGCGVVVKAHSSHPGTAELVATALTRAVEQEGMPRGTFSLIHGPGATVGTALVKHPLIRAVGFTGSRTGGTALIAAAASRPDPIPVYAEMGSTNPVFILPGALTEGAAALAEGLKNSVTLGVGQFCTNPGLVVGVKSPQMSSFVQSLGSLMGSVPAQTMLNAKIHRSYAAGVEELKESAGVRIEAEAEHETLPNRASAAVFATDAATFVANLQLAEEVFGPSTLVVEGASHSELIDVAEHMEGHLTATIHGSEADLAEYSDLIAILERKVGRLIFNGVPTGVEVCHSMNHGGPYPASADPHFTSVGTAAIFRFARPVCYQGFPESQLPPELRDANPLKIYRLLDGEFDNGVADA